MKKFLALLLAMTCVLSLVGCGQTETNGTTEITIGDTTITINKGEDRDAAIDEVTEAIKDKIDESSKADDTKVEEENKPTDSENKPEETTKPTDENTGDKPWYYVPTEEELKEANMDMAAYLAYIEQFKASFEEATGVSVEEAFKDSNEYVIEENGVRVTYGNDGSFSMETVGEIKINPEDIEVAPGVELIILPDMSDLDYSDTSFENPGEMGEWHKTTRYNAVSKDYDECCYKVDAIMRGDEALKFVEDYNSTDHVSKFQALEDDDLEYCVIKYTVYFPDDFPQNDWGISSADLRFDIEPTDPNASTFVVDGVSYVGIGFMYNASEYIETNTLFAGDTWTGYGVFGMHKEVDEFIIVNEASDKDYNVIGTSYTMYKD